MITMKEWMELVDYRITEGSAFMWQCYGTDAYQLDSWNGDLNGHSFCITFDTKTQTVYEVQAHDYTNERAYRMINPDFKKKMKKESKRRNVERNQAWDDVDYVDLEVDDDFIRKCLAIKAGEKYDTRVTVPLTLSDEETFGLMKMAHAQDITLNQLVEDMLKIYIKQAESDKFDEEDLL
jgi:predicted HicB family RNase H-like nuclease